MGFPRKLSFSVEFSPKVKFFSWVSPRKLSFSVVFPREKLFQMVSWDVKKHEKCYIERHDQNMEHDYLNDEWLKRKVSWNKILLLKFCKVIISQNWKCSNRWGNARKCLPDSNALKVDKNKLVINEKIEKNCLNFS